MYSDRELLAKLVAFDSTSHLSNRPIADFICDALDRPGIKLTRQPAPEGDKLNLVVEVGPPIDPESRGLCEASASVARGSARESMKSHGRRAAGARQ